MKKKIKSQSLPKTVYLLALCQALMMSSTSLMMTVAALVGYQLADDKALATLPLSLQFLGLMTTSIPASLLMGHLGRKAGFIIGSLFGIAGGLMAMWSILNEQFWGFALASFLIGIFNGFGSYYRFAAVDVADEVNRPRAISYVMAGGIVAAFIGPNLTNMSEGLFAGSQFAGGFAFMVLFYLMVMFILFFIEIPNSASSEINEPSRSLKEIAKQPTFIVAILCGMFGYAVMSYLMTATPLAMKHHAHVFDDTAFVIQWHLFAMFAPSFVTGTIIQRHGLLNVMVIGALLGVICVVINLVGHTVWHFWTALVALGVSWNFLFIGATNLLTGTYRPVEKAKAQALNDFLVFTTVTIASLSAGFFQHKFGWEMVNIGALPLLTIILISLWWLIRTPENERINR